MPSPLPEERIIDRGEKDTTEKTTMQQPHGRGYPTPSCLGQPQISVGSYEVIEIFFFFFNFSNPFYKKIYFEINFISAEANLSIRCLSSSVSDYTSQTK